MWLTFFKLLLSYTRIAFSQAVPKVTLDPEQMVQLMTNEQRLSETIPQVLNSNTNQGNFVSRPGAQHFVRLDSEQLDILIQHQQQQQNASQESRIVARASAPVTEYLRTNDEMPPSYEEYVNRCEKRDN